jgi:hypothetical protein
MALGSPHSGIIPSLYFLRHEENFSAISIHTYLQCCQGADFSAAELDRDTIKIGVVEKLKVQFSLDIPKKG